MTARDIALDDAGDWNISGGDLTLVSDGPAILQALIIALEFFKGEWFLDEEAGLPYFQDVLVKNPDPNVLQSVFRTAILDVPGVLAINELTLLFDTAARTFAVTFRVSTDFGELVSTVGL